MVGDGVVGGKAVLHDCCISLVSLLIFLYTVSNNLFALAFHAIGRLCSMLAVIPGHLL